MCRATVEFLDGLASLQQPEDPHELHQPAEASLAEMLRGKNLGYETSSSPAALDMLGYAMILRF